LLKPIEQWYPIDYLTYSFGQGFAITPIQLIRAFSTLANNGVLVKPTIVEAYYDKSSKETIEPETASLQKVFSQKTASVMKELLLNAINNSEANWPNKPAGYQICGKTGTAQIAVSGHYDPTQTVASFIGFLPCQKPKYISLVLYYQPKSSPWGSETAAPTFFEIANKLILYYNITP
jgi:cell division protein FtsI (penicillin-binding protein 3)